MPKNKRPYGISGTPWHEEYLHTESDDDRRDKRRCLYYESGKNFCSIKNERCIGSSHCEQYGEKESRPQATKYIYENGRYYHVKESITRPTEQSKAFIGRATEQDIILSYNDYVNRNVIKNTHIITRYKSGTKVISEALGEGTIIENDSKYIKVAFNSKTSQFTHDAFDNGYLRTVGEVEKEVLYQTILWHQGLPAYQIVETDSESEQAKSIETIIRYWDQEWKMKIADLAQRHTSVYCLSFAKRLTEQVGKNHQRLSAVFEENRYLRGVNIDGDWENQGYFIPEPNRPAVIPIPKEPKIEDYGTERKRGFFQRLFRLSPFKISPEARGQFESDHLLWKQNVERITQKNTDNQTQYILAYEKWEREKNSFYAAEVSRRKDYLEKIEGVKTGNKTAIEWYVTQSLKQISLPIYFEKKIAVDYQPNFNRLKIDYLLPNIHSIPRIKRLSYTDSTDMFKEEVISRYQWERLHYSINCQIIKCIANILFGGNENLFPISKLVINGKLKKVDSNTKPSCVINSISINVSKDTFQRMLAQDISAEEMVDRLKAKEKSNS